MRSAAIAAGTPPGIPSATHECHVETISDYESFLRLEPIWDQVLEEAGTDHPFATHEWVRTWLDCFGAGQDLMILVVRSGQRVLAIAPLIMAPGRMHGIRVRRLRLIHNVYTERCDFMIAGRPEQAYRAIWRHLSDLRAAWDVLELPQLRATSRTLGELARLAAEDGFRTGRWRSGESPYLKVHGGWEGYLQTLDSKHRSNLRNRHRRLRELGAVELEVICGGAGMEASLEDGLALEAEGWKGTSGTAIQCVPEARLFYVQFARRAARREWLRLYFLKLNRRRIAFHYCLHFKNKLYLLKQGYDPRYAPCSPSTILFQMALRDAFDRGVSEYDFLGTDEPWKRRWTSTTRAHDWLYVFGGSLRPRFLHWAKFSAAPILKSRRGSP